MLMDGTVALGDVQMQLQTYYAFEVRALQESSQLFGPLGEFGEDLCFGQPF